LNVHNHLGYTALAEVRAAGPEQTGGIAKPPPVASGTISRASVHFFSDLPQERSKELARHHRITGSSRH
jgi:hypothetical protein